MIRSISNKFIAIILVVVVSTLLCFSFPKLTKADPIALTTLGVGAAVVAILGAFGVSISLNDSANYSNDDFISALDKILPFNQNFQDWREGMQITDTGKIFVRNDILGSILTGFYDQNKDNFSSHLTENAVFGGSSYIFSADVDYTVTNLPDGQIFQSGDVVSGLSVSYNSFSTSVQQLVSLNVISQAKANETISFLTSQGVDFNNSYIAVGASGDNWIYIYTCPLSSIIGKTVRSVNRYSHGAVYILNSNITLKYYTNFSLTNNALVSNGFGSGYVLDGNYYSYNIIDGEVADNSILGTISLDGSALKDLSTWGGILDKINRVTGLDLAPDQTQPDVIVKNPESDDPIDYPIGNTGTVINSGVTAEDLEEWADRIIDRTLGRDLDNDLDVDVSGEAGTIGTIDGEVLSDNAIDWNLTDSETLPQETEMPDVISIKKQVRFLSGLKLLFPFCIPFDLYEIVKIFNATPEPIRFNWTFDFTAINAGTYQIDVDLSRFNTVAKIFRLMLFLGFLIFLTLKTRDLIRG